jgi:hypothetical protein
MRTMEEVKEMRTSEETGIAQEPPTALRTKEKRNRKKQKQPVSSWMMWKSHDIDDSLEEMRKWEDEVS